MSSDAEGTKGFLSSPWTHQPLATLARPHLARYASKARVVGHQGLWTTAMTVPFTPQYQWLIPPESHWEIRIEPQILIRTSSATRSRTLLAFRSTGNGCRRGNWLCWSYRFC